MTNQGKRTVAVGNESGKTNQLDEATAVGNEQEKQVKERKQCSWFRGRSESNQVKQLE